MLSAIVLQSSPVLSVVLPVYNGLPYLRQAVESVLTQSFGNFELIVINDGSSDGSQELLETFDDPRLRIVQQVNKGLSSTLNVGIAQARGRYIARQDQDDVCLPARFEKQVAFLEANPGVGLVGTAAEIWVGGTKTDRMLHHPSEAGVLAFSLLFNNYVVHSSVMLRRSVLQSVGGYSEDKTRQPPEDYELWSRISKQFDVTNLPEVLHAYRELPNSMSRTGHRPFLGNLVKLCAENIAFATATSADSLTVVALANLLHDNYTGIPAGVTLAKLQGLVASAADNVSKRYPASRLAIDVAKQQKIREMRLRFIDYTSGGLFTKLSRSKVSVVTKRLLGFAR